jgi:hypothetical protein
MLQEKDEAQVHKLTESMINWLRNFVPSNNSITDVVDITAM